MAVDANLDQPTAPLLQAETDAAALVAFAGQALGPLQNPSGLYCFDRAFGGPRRSESVRYSLMVLLGAARAAAAGIDTGVDVERLLQLCLARPDSLSPGDAGLALRAEVRLGRPANPDLVRAIGAVVDGGISGLPGMEVAWIIDGLAETVHAGSADTRLLKKAIDHLKLDRLAPSGLFYHYGDSRIRRHLPNFATEIYTVACLTTAGRHHLDGEALELAVATAEVLLANQRWNGGWPWLYHADSGRVVEVYEIYSVHQDAMAPMALLPLSEATGDPRFAEAAVAGLAWSRGANELGFDLIDVAGQFAHRSIRRRASWPHAALALNSGLALAGRRPSGHLPDRLEVNRTCRPYHLGWILEAWSGWTPSPPPPSCKDALGALDPGR